MSLLSDDEAYKDRHDAGDRERRERLVKKHHGEKHRDQRLCVEEERGLRDAKRLHSARPRRVAERGSEHAKERESHEDSRIRESRE